MEILPRIPVPEWVMKKLSAEDNTPAWNWVNKRVAIATNPDNVFGKEEDCEIPDGKPYVYREEGDECPECGEELLWDSDERIVYCINDWSHN